MTLVRFNYPSTTNLTSAFGRSPWSGLESEIDRLFGSALSNFTAADYGHRFPVDFYEDKDNAYVRAELPGLNREDINLELAEGYLTISGTRKVTDDDGKVTESVALSRSLAVPETVESDKVSAAYENGVLTVTLPKREETKPRKVTINIK